MVGRCNFVSDPIFLHELLEKSVAEMLSPIIDDGTWCPKTCKHIFFQKLKHNSMIISFANNGLHSFGNVVNYHEDEEVPIRVGEGSHEVDAPNIKEFHNKD
jgi:hypothetical protein